MGKVEIKIRKKILTPDNLQQYRNYPALLKKYERNKRFKRALRIFIYSLALTLFVLALIFLSMWKVLLDKKQEESNTQKIFSYGISKGSWEIVDTVSTVINSQIKNDSAFSIVYGGTKAFPKGEYWFPIDSIHGTVDNFSFVSHKEYLVNGKQYPIFKYFYDVPDSFDEEAFYYYSPDFGIVAISPVPGIIYVKLINSKHSPNPEITLLSNLVVEDINRSFKFSPPP